MKTISNSIDSMSAVLFAILGGKFRLQLEDPKALPGQRYAMVLDDEGSVIGNAYDYVYNGNGFAVHTKPFAGHVSLDQIEFV